MYSQTEKQKEEKYCFRIGRRAQIIDKGLVGAPGFEPGTSCAQVLIADCDGMLLRGLESTIDVGFSPLGVHSVVLHLLMSRSVTEESCVTNRVTILQGTLLRSKAQKGGRQSILVRRDQDGIDRYLFM